MPLVGSNDGELILDRCRVAAGMDGFSRRLAHQGALNLATCTRKTQEFFGGVLRIRAFHAVRVPASVGRLR